ncbi:MAG: dTMP kinase [Thermodesulfobacteriota bacterium]
MGRGFFIVLEGIDGAGKTTQARLLGRALKERGYRVVLTREPSAGPQGVKLRRYLRGPSRHLKPAEELEMFLADRREHVREVIKPALAAGSLVISDRYYYSSVAYQGALGIDPAAILALNQAFAPEPDLVVVLTLPVPAALARRSQGRGAPLQVSETSDYLEKVAAIYAGLNAPWIHRVEAAGTPAEIHARILRLTLEALGES